MPATVCEPKPKRRSSTNSRSTVSKARRRSTKSRSTASKTRRRSTTKTRTRRSKACVPRVRLNNCCRSFDTDMCISYSPGKYSDGGDPSVPADEDLGDLAGLFSEDTAGGRQVRFVQDDDGGEDLPGGGIGGDDLTGGEDDFTGGGVDGGEGEPAHGGGGMFDEEERELAAGGGMGGGDGNEPPHGGGMFREMGGGEESELGGEEENELAHVLEHYRNITKDNQMLSTLLLIQGLMEVDALQNSNGFIRVGSATPNCDLADMQQNTRCGATFLNLANDGSLPAELTAAADRQMQEFDNTVFAFVVTDGDGQRLNTANAFENYMRTNSFYSSHVHVVVVSSSSRADMGVTYLSWHEGANLLTSSWNPREISNPDRFLSQHVQSLQADESVTRKGHDARAYYNRLALDEKLGLMFSVLAGVRDIMIREEATPMYGLITIDDINRDTCFSLSTVSEENEDPNASACGMTMHDWEEPAAIVDNYIHRYNDNPDKTVVAYVYTPDSSHVASVVEELAEATNEAHKNLHVVVFDTTKKESTMVSRHLEGATTFIASRNIRFDSTVDYTTWTFDTWMPNIEYFTPSFKDDVAYVSSDDGDNDSDNGEYKYGQDENGDEYRVDADGDSDAGEYRRRRVRGVNEFWTEIEDPDQQ